MREVNDEKIKNVIMVCIICLLGVPITLFIAFFVAIDKVYASNMEISVNDLSMPIEYLGGYYSANTGGTQTRSTINVGEPNSVYTMGNERKFLYYYFSNNQLYKFIAFQPYEYAFREGEYYTVSIYLRSASGAPFGNNWGICVGSYSGCVSPNRQYGQYYFAQSTNFYLYRQKELTAGEPEWSRITNVYKYTFVVKAYDDGTWVFYRHNNTYSGTIAFYGYTVEYAGSSFASVTNAIAQQTTTINNSTNNAINNSTSTINNNTTQQNEQTRQTVEEQEQQTRDTITDSNTDFDSPDIDTDTGPISGLLTMPITLARAITNNSSSCSAFQLGNLMGTNLTMPCIDLESILGSTLYNIIDVICCGIFIFTLRKVLVNVYVKVMSLRNINPGEVS